MHTLTLALALLLAAATSHASPLHPLPAHRFSTLPFPHPLSAKQSLPTTTLREGLTLDPCRTDAQCQADRICIEFDFGGTCTEADEACICFPQQDQFCDATVDCDLGEVCVLLFPGEPSVCLSAAYAREFLDPDFQVDGGYTRDPCLKQPDCKGTRQCRVAATGRLKQLCNKADNCVCTPPTPKRCTQDTDCPDQEMCATGPSFTDPSCISRVTVFVNDRFTSVDDDNLDTPAPSPMDPADSPDPSPSAQAPPPGPVQPTPSFDQSPPPSPSMAMTPEPSLILVASADPTPSASAQMPEPIPSPVGPAPLPSPSDGVGFPSAVPVPTETIDLTPMPSDQAVFVSPTPEASSGVLAPSPSGVLAPSPSGVLAPSPSEAAGDGNATATATPTVTEASAVCIDAEALQHLERSELVFKEHAWGWVLCDTNGSCATRGHMVVFRGEAMMMGRYCELVECVQRRMRVNSPRYVRKMRVASRTEGLEYTAFAARYESRVEERVLATAVRVGL